MILMTGDSLGQEEAGEFLLRYRFQPRESLIYLTETEKTDSTIFNQSTDKTERRLGARETLTIEDTSGGFRILHRVDSTWSKGHFLFHSDTLAERIQKLDAGCSDQTLSMDAQGEALAGPASLSDFLLPLPVEPVGFGDSWDFEIRRLIEPMKGKAVVQGQCIVIGMETDPSPIVLIMANLDIQIEQQGIIPSGGEGIVFSRTLAEYVTRLVTFDVNRGRIRETDSDATSQERIESTRFDWKASSSSKSACRLVEP